MVDKNLQEKAQRLLQQQSQQTPTPQTQPLSPLQEKAQRLLDQPERQQQIAQQGVAQQVAQFAAQGQEATTPELPYGAQSWMTNYQGKLEAYYGAGLKGYWQEKKSKVLAPVEGYNAQTKAYETRPPNWWKLLGRGLKEGLFTVGDIFGLGAKATKAWVGLGMGYDEAADFANSPLPSIGDAPGFWDYIVKSGPAVMMLNQARILTGTRNREDIQRETMTDIEKNVQASRILYSSILDPMKRQEFIRRYEAGENPDFIAARLRNPWIELVGELIFDPMNVAGVAIGRAAKAARLAKAEAKIMDVAPDIAKGLQATAEAARGGKTAEAGEAVFKLADTVLSDNVNRAVRFAQEALPTASRWTMTARRQMVAESTRTVATGILAGFRDKPNEGAQIIKTMIGMAGDDITEIRAATSDAVLHYGDLLFTDGARDTGILLRRMLTNAEGGVDAEDFLKLLNKKDLPEFITVMGAKMDKALDEMFPKVTELAARRSELLKLAKAGDTAAAEAAKNIKINPLLLAASRAHEFAQNQLGVRKINRFFSNVYFGLHNPGPTLRNLFSNETLGVLDNGTHIWAKSARAFRDEVALWRGGMIPEAAERGFAGAGTILNAEGKVDKSLLKPMQLVERNSGMRIWGSVYLNSMKNDVTAWVATHSDEIRSAGVSDKALKRLEQLVILNRGNVDEAAKAFRAEFAAKGGAEIWKVPELWMHPQDIANAQNAKIWDFVQEALNSDDPIKALRGIVTEREKVAGKIYEEAAESLDVFKDVIRFVSKDQRKAFEARVMADQVAADELHRAFNNIWNAALLASDEASKVELIAIKSHWADEIAPLRNAARIKSGGLVEEVLDWVAEAKDYEKLWPEITTHEQWVELGLSTELPKNVQAFRDIMWDEFFRPASELNYRNALGGMKAGFSQYVDEMMALAGGNMPDVGNIIADAFGYVAEADKTSQALFKGNTALYNAYQAAVKRGDNASAIRILAEKYGFSTATPAGVPTDKNLLAAINSREYTAEERIGFVLREMRDIIAGSEPGKRTAAATWGSMYPNWYSKNNLAERAGNKSGMLTMLDKMLAGEARDTAIARELRGIAIDQIKNGRVVSNAPPDIEAMKALGATKEELAEAIKTFEDITSEAYKAGGYQSLNEVPVEAARKALDAWATEKGRTIPKIEEMVEKLAPASDGEAFPSEARAAYESLPGLRDFINRTVSDLSTVKGQVEKGTFTPELEKALFAWQKEARIGLAEIDMRAVAKATEARDFALNNYGKQDVFDLAYAYLMPYGFWYRQTYTKMLRRLAEDPQVLAAYAKYRNAMEEQNSNLPDWWKYNIRIDNIPGIDLKHPLFFNLEATLNPLNGITGVDFDDPYKRVNWWTSMLDDIADYGPSIWAPVNLATAFALQVRGETDTASRWAGRIFPQTAAIKAITNIAGVKAGGQELDPAVVLFSGGLDPYERNRVGRALGMLVNEGANEAEATEAARTQSGPLWEAAKIRAMEERQWGQLAGYFLGIGFRNRSESDLSIDQFYNDYNSIWNNAPNLSGEELRAALDRLRKDYPFMDVLILARRGSTERDRSYAYSVLSRIPPAQLDDVSEAVGLDRRLINKFYDEKGRIDKWPESDRLAFMSAMIGIGARLDVPPQATRTEWAAASAAYKTMTNTGEQAFGEGIWDEVEVFYQQENKDLWLQSHPNVQAAMDWKAQYVMSSPLLAAYYGGNEIFYRYYHGQMLKEATDQLGPNILAVMDAYWQLYNYGNEVDSKAYKRAHPEIAKYFDIRDKWQPEIDRAIARILKNLPEGEGPVYRKESQFPSLAEQDLTPQQPLTWDEWRGLMSSSTSEALVAYFRTGAKLPYYAERQLKNLAEERGVYYSALLTAIGQVVP
ncbi:hypothetical protein AUJ15_02925 [Candidatus Micrarchaeota archaeon CG1_02_55_41]|nr:MAG: hypothetical protein AUJ15_02925 [Candidatus Micrarchaeota archaeon CG1_02_55_41]